jgi:hypothetical protein
LITGGLLKAMGGIIFGPGMPIAAEQVIRTGVIGMSVPSYFGLIDMEIEQGNIMPR